MCFHSINRSVQRNISHMISIKAFHLSIDIAPHSKSKHKQTNQIFSLSNSIFLCPQTTSSNSDAQRRRSREDYQGGTANSTNHSIGEWKSSYERPKPQLQLRGIGTGSTRKKKKGKEGTLKRKKKEEKKGKENGEGDGASCFHSNQEISQKAEVSSQSDSRPGERGRMAQAGTLTCRDRIDEILSSGPRANHELPRIYARSVDEKAKGQRAEHRGSSKGVRTALTVT